MSKSFGLMVVLASALGFSSFAFAANGAQNTQQPATTAAQPATGSHAKQHPSRAMGVLDKLDLTDSQRTSIEQAMRERMQHARPEMEALMQKREAFEQATPGSSNYQSAANDLATASANAARNRVNDEAALRTKVYDILTPEQRTKLASLRAERKAEIQKWRQEHMQHDMSEPAQSQGTH